jgi:hypothetical protein
MKRKGRPTQLQPAPEQPDLSPDPMAEPAMSDRAATTDAPEPPASAAALGSLEQRVHRLEDAVALLQNTDQLEERVVERVSARIDHGGALGVLSEPTRLVLDAGRRLLPAPIDTIPAAEQRTADDARTTRPARPRPGLVLDAWLEFRAIFRMYFDPRYHLTRTTRLLPPVLLGLIVTSWYWVPFSSLPVVGTLLDKALDLVLGFLLYKVLSREARLYRETSPDVPRSLRLP